MKSTLVRIVIAAVFAFEAWTQFRCSMKMDESNRLLAVGGVEAYSQQRAIWLRRCLSFAEAIDDPVIRAREIEALNFRLANIDQESTDILGEELQVERTISSTPTQVSPVAMAEDDTISCRKLVRRSTRKSRRKSNHRFESKATIQRLSA